MPLGQVPVFLQLVGRAVVAAFLLAAIPDIMNLAADITDQFASQIGSLNNFNLVLHRMGEKIGTLSWSWVSVKDSVILLVSYVSFFLLYISVYMADTLFAYTWMLLYIFSPLLMAAFVLPGTAGATRGYFQALVEVCLWKIIWSVIATLLWSYSLSKINDPKYGTDFITAILMNLILAFSVVVTPSIARGLLNGGIHSTASSLGGAILGVASLTPKGIAGKVKNTISRSVGAFKLKAKEDKAEEDESDK